MPDISFVLPESSDVLALAMRKFNLDIDHRVAEIAKLDVEKQKLSNEAAAQKQLIRQLKADADVSEVRARENKLQYDIDRSRNFYHCIYRFTDTVDGTSVEEAINTLTVWDRLYPGHDFEIVFNSRVEM